MKKEHSINRYEIIRGFRKFEYILENGSKCTNNYLTSFVIKKDADSSLNCMRVGFLLSKKKIKKSHERNRLKRLFRESYRVNKTILEETLMDYKINLDILISISNKGYNCYKKINISKNFS